MLVSEFSNIIVSSIPGLCSKDSDLTGVGGSWKKDEISLDMANGIRTVYLHRLNKSVGSKFLEGYSN